ncbi:MAG: efflux RND transporter periplasmic adaptor subunit [Lachnospiraceae bacterium]|nr:efflux RND transporter periplasmic adaptor subunit [Muribaculaceae bacterium]MCM1411886.1 efflux RND transporter periplasmic adaptor subunit [Lachnospiraceae bacterium]
MKFFKRGADKKAVKKDETKKTPPKGKKRLWILIAIVLIIILAGVGGAWFFLKKRNGQIPNLGFGGNRGNFSMAGITEDMVTASGVINMGMTVEEFSVENLETTLEIEEVYVASGDEVEKGTKILKLSEDDVAEARAELEKVLRETELAYRAGAIEYEQNKITAVYDRDSALLEGKQAQAIYNETVTNLNSAVDRAQDSLDEAKEKIEEYSSYVNDGTYRAYFKVDEYQAIYDENLQVIVDRLDEYGISWAEITGAGGQTVPGGQNNPAGNNTFSISGGDSMEGSTASVSGGDADAGSIVDMQAYNQEVQMLSSLYKILEQNLKDLEQAQADYDEAVANAAFELQTLQLKLPSLELALTEAKENYSISMQQAKLTYETSLANAERAESDYETAVQKAESDYGTLLNAYEDAGENLEIFENLVGDGYFYASGNGTILRTMVRAGQSLSAESTVFMYTDIEEMTVTVSVDQSDIAKVNLGDTATVVTSSYGYFDASVSEINPVSSSTSRSSVSYNVVLTLTGDTSGLSSNESVTVVIGMDVSQMENMGGQNPGGEGMPEGSQMPEGFEMPGDGQIPEGFEMPGDGQMPEGLELPEDDQMPEGFEMPGGGQIPEGFEMPEGGQMPEGFEMPGGGQGSFGGAMGQPGQ